MKEKYKYLFFIIGVAGLAVLISQVNLKSIDWDHTFLIRLPCILIASLVIWVFIFSLHTLVYRRAIGEPAKNIGWFTLFKLCVTGYALNNVTPAGLVGGEPYRIMALEPYCGIKRATSSTFTFTIFYIMGHFALWVTGCVLYFVIGAPGGLGPSIGVGVALVIVTLVLVFFFFSKKTGFVMGGMKLLSKMPFLGKIIRQKLDKNSELYQMIDDEINIFRQTPKSFWMAIILEYITRILEGFEYFVILKFFGAPVHPLDGIIVLTFASLIGNIVFVIPLQAGTREGGMALYLDWLGIDSPTILMVGIAYRIRELLTNAVGILGILITKAKKPTPSSEKNSQEDPESSDNK